MTNNILEPVCLKPKLQSSLRKDTDSTILEGRIKKLYWRACHRGTKELDLLTIVFVWWLLESPQALDNRELALSFLESFVLWEDHQIYEQLMDKTSYLFSFFKVPQDIQERIVLFDFAEVFHRNQRSIFDSYERYGISMS